MAITVGILGASGYTGAELLRLIADHPELEVQVVTGDSQAGKRVSDIYPHLSRYGELVLSRFEESQSELNQCEVVFCGLPHGETMRIAPTLKSRVVIDLGSDFRLKDSKVYEAWYHRPHSAVASLADWQYGLPELFRSQIKEADRIANPGCYATAVILALAPLYREGLIHEVAVVDAVSGTSGAGRALAASVHASHTHEDVRAYKVTAHQHTPEMEAALSQTSGREVRLSFTAHLAPMSRGIHATCSALVTSGVTHETLRDAFIEAYRDEQFVRFVTEQPGTKEVRGSNMVKLAVHYDARTERAIVTAVLDNLVKGAAGQAIQNCNIILGLSEDTGLTHEALYP